MKHNVDPLNHDFVELLQKMVLIVGVLMGIHRDWKMDESAQNYAKQSKKLTAANRARIVFIDRELNDVIFE